MVFGLVLASYVVGSTVSTGTMSWDRVIHLLWSVSFITVMLSCCVVSSCGPELQLQYANGLLVILFITCAPYLYTEWGPYTRRR